MNAVIFGTGWVAVEIYNMLIKKYGEDYVEFFVDSMLKKESLFDKPVYSLEELKLKDYNQYTYYFGSLSSQASMKEELLKIGINENCFSTKFDYSEDNFEKSVTKLDDILIYPTPDDEQRILLQSKFSEYLGTYIDDIHFHYEPERNICEYDCILVWDGKYIADDILFDSDRVFCIDENFYITISGRIFTHMYNKLYEKHNGNICEERSKKLFEKLKNYNAKSAYIFASGPSLEEGIEKYLKDGDKHSFRGVCNGYVQSSKDIDDKIKPNLYLLVDSKFVGELLNTITAKVCNYVLNNECYLVVPKAWVPLLSDKYGVTEKIIGLGMKAKEMQFPSVEDLNIYNKATNVVTTIGIPIMSSLADNIYFTGCDGTANKKEIRWEHSKSVDILNVIKPYTKVAKKTGEYLDKHELFFSQILEYGESLGKTYESLTPSYIPCLAMRYKE